MSQAGLAALLPRLWCLNWPPASLPATSVRSLRATGVYLDTCLRQLAFGLAPVPALRGLPGELSFGPEAYRLLLEVATGLRSAVPGETNVGGQFRQATEQAAATLAPVAWLELKPVVDALLADARTLRRTHLQGIAGLSYGSLVRALLAPRQDARILFVGTGALTRSMLPLFAGHLIGIWNRRWSAPPGGASRCFAPNEADEAVAWATNIVLTVPADRVANQLWSARLRQYPQRSVVHLGWRSGTFGDDQAPHFTLDDVFALAGSRDPQANRRLARAVAACGELVARRLKPARQRAASRIRQPYPGKPLAALGA